MLVALIIKYLQEKRIDDDGHDNDDYGHDGGDDDGVGGGDDD